MNALQTFFGKEAYREMGDEAVLASHPAHCVARPPGWLGGGDLSKWLNEYFGESNHCWLSAHGRGSHLFFMTPAQAETFKRYLAIQDATTRPQVIALAEKIVQLPASSYGYSDVGDVLVRYLQQQIDGAEALEELKHLQADYQRVRDEDGQGTNA